MLKLINCLIYFSLVLIVFSSCSNENTVEIDFNKGKVLDVSDNDSLEQKEPFLRIAIGSMITPREGYAFYKKLLDYIGEKMGQPVKLIDRDNYTEVNNLLKSGDIDIAFVCSRPYVDGHSEFGLELLVAPQIKGTTEYYSYIIVHTNSAMRTFNDLRGKTFAFTDPQSNTGKLVPTFMLDEINETPVSFFEKHIFTYAHDKSIKAVANKIVDGAAVDSLIWEYYNKFNPEITSKTRIIMKSPPYGIQPVVVPPGMDSKTKNKLRNIFLNIHEDEKGKNILDGMMIDKFVLVEDSNYDFIRQMIAKLEETAIR